MKDVLQILEEDARTSLEDIAAMTGRRVEEVQTSSSRRSKTGSSWATTARSTGRRPATTRVGPHRGKVTPSEGGL